MSKTQAETLVAELAQEWELPELAMDADDYFCVQPADGVVLNVDYFEAADVFSLYTTVAEIPAQNRLAAFESMLRANFGWEETGGATLALDSTGELALLTAEIPVDGLDLPVMLDRIETFSRLAWSWSKKINALAEESEAAEPSETMMPDLA